MVFASFDNRKEPRMALTFPVRLDWVDEIGQELSEETVTENISNGGACLVMKTCLRVGKRLNINLNIEGQIGSSTAVVKWAAITATGFTIGVRFEGC